MSPRDSLPSSVESASVAHEISVGPSEAGTDSSRDALREAITRALSLHGDVRSPVPSASCFSDDSPPDPGTDDWLLADGRWMMARLEGENQALRKQVEKVRHENEELSLHFRVAEERNRSLEEENRATAQALDHLTFFAQLRGKLPNSLVLHVRDGVSGAADTAFDSWHLPSTSRPEQPPSEDDLAERCLEAEAADAREKLLDMSENIGRRMEQIFSRLKLPAVQELGGYSPSDGLDSPSG